MLTETMALESTARKASPIGRKLLNLRKQQKLSVSALSSKSDLSVGIISQIERDLANPSIKTLEKLSTALGVPLSELLETESSIPTVNANAANAGTQDVRKHQQESKIIRRQANRPKFDVGSAPIYKELLSPSGAEDIRFMIIRVPPHARAEEMKIGPGQKAGLLIEGVMQLTLAEEHYELYAGDSFQFDANQPHEIANNTDADVRVLWIMTSVPTIHM